MLNFSNIDQKAQTSADAYLRSSVTVLDGYGSKGEKRRPYKQDAAVKQFCSWVYRAAMLNARQVSSTPLRLYARKKDGVTQKLYRTAKVSRSRKRFLLGEGNSRPSQGVMRKLANFGSDFEEVTEPHPALEVLASANPWQNGFELSVLRMLYLQITGNAYLHPVMEPGLGRPSELWIMPSQWVQVIPSRTDFISGYVYGKSREVQREFAVDEVIHWKLPNLEDIFYGRGWVEALWSALGLHNAKRTRDTAFMDNMCRPDWLLVVKNGAGPDALDRLEEAVESKLKGAGNAGKFLTVTGDITLTPLNLPVEEIGDPDKIIEEIAAVSDVPLYKLRGSDPTKANAETADFAWLRDTIAPYCRMDEEQLNAKYLPLFGIEGDAVLAYDNPVPEDRMRDVDILVKQTGGAYKTVNEAREDDNLEPIEGGDVLRDPSQDPMAQLLGGFMAGSKPMDGATAVDEDGEPIIPPTGPDGKPLPTAAGMPEPSLEQSPAVATNDLRATIGGSAAILALQEAYYSGALPRAAAIGNATLVFGFTTQEAEALFPEEPPNAPKSEQQLADEEAQREALRVGSGDGDAPKPSDKPSGGDAPPNERIRHFSEAASGGDDGEVRKERAGVGHKARINSTANGIARELPQGSELVPLLVRAFEGQREELLKALVVKSIPCHICGAVDGQVHSKDCKFTATKAPTRADVAAMLSAANTAATAISAKWNSVIAAEAKPVIQSIMREEGRKLIVRIAAQAKLQEATVSGAFDVFERRIPEAAQRMSIKLAESINETTAKNIGEAVQELRNQIAEGLSEGDTRPELTKRVNEIFEDATKRRAETIARTEASKAAHQGELAAARDSGVVSKKFWLASGDACPKCEAVVAANPEGVAVDAEFAPGVTAPPLHPNCQCSTTYSIRDDGGR